MKDVYKEHSFVSIFENAKLVSDGAIPNCKFSGIDVHLISKRAFEALSEKLKEKNIVDPVVRDVREEGSLDVRSVVKAVVELEKETENAVFFKEKDLAIIGSSYYNFLVDNFYQEN